MIQLLSLLLINRCPKNTHIALHIMLVLFALNSANTLAQKWQYQGVLTQGISITDENNFFGDSDESPSFEYTEASLSGSYQFHRSSRISGQALYRRAGAIDEASIDYLVLDSQFFSSDALISGIRLGRYKQPYGLYNETRDVAFARQSVLLAQSLYSDSQRDLKLSSDGLLLYTSLFNDYGQWDFDLSYGAINLDNVSGFSGFPSGGEFDNEYAAVGRVLFESFDSTWRAAITILDAGVGITFNLQPLFGTPNELISGGDLEEQEVFASIEYNWHNWLFSSEYRFSHTQTFFSPVQISVPIDITNPALGFRTFSPDINIDRDGEAYYFQAKYIFNPQWTSYIRWDVVYDDKNDKNGDSAVNAPHYSMYAKDLTVGTLWNINASMLWGVEIHHVKGTQWLSTIDNPAPFDTKEDWNLFVSTFSYRF